MMKPGTTLLTTAGFFPVEVIRSLTAAAVSPEVSGPRTISTKGIEQIRGHRTALADQACLIYHKSASFLREAEETGVFEMYDIELAAGLR